MHYKPTGVCSQYIEFDIEDNKVKNSFVCYQKNYNRPVLEIPEEVYSLSYVRIRVFLWKNDNIWKWTVDNFQKRSRLENQGKGEV